MAFEPTPITLIIDEWLDHPYLDRLMWDCEETRYVIDKLYDLNEKDKCISQTYVIGLLKSKLNNALLKRYSVEEYLTGISNLCKYYYTYKETDRSDIVIKKSWMSVKNKKRFFEDHLRV